MKIEGTGGNILFLKNDYVKIIKLHSFDSKEEFVIPFSQIASIDIKRPAFLSKGYIQFRTTGIIQRHIWFKGEENYKTAIEIQKRILNYRK